MTVASPPQPVTRAEARRAWRERRRRLRRWEAPPFRRPGGPASPRPRIYQVRLLAPLAATWLVMALAVSGRPVPPWLAPAGLAVVGLVGFVATRRAEMRRVARGRAAQGSVALALATLVCALVAGLLAGEAMERRDAGIADLAAARAVATLTGTVLTTPRLLASSIAGVPQQAAVTIAASHVTGRGTERDLATRVTLFAPASDTAALLPGSAVTVTGRLAPPSRAGDVASTLRLTRVDAETEPRGVRALPRALRHSMDAATERLHAERAGLVRGMTFGDTRLLPDSDASALRAAGLTHLTAVSGANLAMVAGAASLLLRPTRWRRRTKAAALAAVIVVYVLAVGNEPSVVRAAGMAGLVLSAQWLGRPRAGLAILLATALGLLWYDPFLAVNAGFALSVAATGSIIAFAKPCAEQWCRVLRVPYWLSLPLAVTTVAQCACTPLLVVMNPALPTYAVPANALAAPLVAPLTVVALAASVVGLAPGGGALATGLAWLAGWFAQGIAWVARVAAELPHSSLPWPAAPLGVWLALVCGVAFAVAVRFAHKYWFSALAAALCVATAYVGAAAYAVQALLPAPPALAPSFVQCDVGQGDALVLPTGAPGHAVMLDVGPDGDAAARCLGAAGVTALDVLVLTHSHADHVGGLDAVLARVNVTRVLSPPPNPADPGEWNGVDRLLTARGLAREVVAAGAVVRSGGVDARVVGPVDPATVTRVAAREQGGSEGSWANDSSLVLVGTVGRVSFAALGDLEPAAQRELLASGVLGRVDVVKVAHHGSPRQTAELYAALAPSVALISVGADNDYGHPGPKTLTLLEGLGARIVRTDIDGAVGIAEQNGNLYRVDPG